MKNHAWIIAKPSHGNYAPDCLRWEERAIPELEDGQFRVKTSLLSIDPTTRHWLLLDPEKSFIPLAVGDPMIGANVGTVIESKNPDFAVGDLVSGLWSWEEYAIPMPMLVEKQIADASIPEEAYLSVFSHVGRAASMGLYAVGLLTSSDLVVVSGAAGATGSVAIQLAKAEGCRVIGIAGGADKAAYVTSIGADEVIDYKTENVATRLAELAPDGVDVFFDNIGGPTLDAVLVNMADGCRIVICGAMSQYDLADPADQYGVKNLQMLLFKNARMEGFVVPKFADRQAEFDALLRRRWAEGKLRQRSHIIDGFEKAPEVVTMNLQGRNQGKLMVRVTS